MDSQRKTRTRTCLVCIPVRVGVIAFTTIQLFAAIAGSFFAVSELGKTSKNKQEALALAYRVVSIWGVALALVAPLGMYGAVTRKAMIVGYYAAAMMLLLVLEAVSGVLLITSLTKCEQPNTCAFLEPAPLGRDTGFYFVVLMFQSYVIFTAAQYFAQRDEEELNRATPLDVPLKDRAVFESA